MSDSEEIDLDKIAPEDDDAEDIEEVDGDDVEDNDDGDEEEEDWEDDGEIEENSPKPKTSRAKSVSENKTVKLKLTSTPTVVSALQVPRMSDSKIPPIAPDPYLTITQNVTPNLISPSGVTLNEVSKPRPGESESVTKARQTLITVIMQIKAPNGVAYDAAKASTLANIYMSKHLLGVSYDAQVEQALGVLTQEINKVTAK